MPIGVALDHAALQPCAHVFAHPHGLLNVGKHLGHRSLGFDLAIFQHQHVCAQAGGFVHRMGHIQHGQMQLVAHFFQPRQDVLTPGRVQGRHGFIEQQQTRLAGERSRQRHPLALATRQTCGGPAQQRANAQQIHSLVQAVCGDTLARPLQAIGQVLHHIQVGQ